MKAIRFQATVPRYLAGKALGALSGELFFRGPGCTYDEDVPEPALRGPRWVKVRTRLGGICGSDIGAITLHTSPYFEPFSSFPYTFGHENVGVIAEVGDEAGDWSVGQRVVVEPLLWCGPRDIEPMCPACQRGEVNLCSRRTDGALAPGFSTGYCKDTGGSWSSHFLAHRTQLMAIPEEVSDDNAVLLDPLAVGIHAVLLDPPREGETVLIQGAGTIGLTMLAALKGLGCPGRIVVAARYPHQADAARRLGADEIVGEKGSDLYGQIADLTGARLFKPMIGKRVMVGGADRTYECVGADGANDDALRLTRAGGSVVLAGLTAQAKGIDWSSIFADELTVRASNVYHHAEPWDGRTWNALELALHLVQTGALDIGWMVTHRFGLDDWQRALHLHRDRAGNGLIKGVFEFPG